MISNEIYLILYDWVNQIINIEGGESVSIIQANQNAPAPNSPYIVIDFAGNRRKIGEAHRTVPAPDTDPVPGLVKVINDEERTIEIREVGGDGDRLDKLMYSIGRSSIQEYFKLSGISYLGQGQVMNIPRLDGEEWIREAIVEIRFGHTSFVETTEESWIETVDIEANVEH